MLGSGLLEAFDEDVCVSKYILWVKKKYTMKYTNIRYMFSTYKCNEMVLF